MPITYPLDFSGVASTNKVVGELHSTSEAQFRSERFIVPNFAPFYVDNFRLTVTVGNVTTPLVEDVDFSFALSYVTGTRTTGKAMYGGVTLLNDNLNGILSMDYQTIGGDQVADRLAVLTRLAEMAYNPRTTIWDILTNVPNALPPIPNHYQDYDQFYGQEKVVEALLQIRDAILTNSSLTQETITQFLQTINNGIVGAYLLKTGDTMTGPLFLNGAPTEALHAATKGYVDGNSVTPAQMQAALANYTPTAQQNAAMGDFVQRQGDTMTGYLNLNADPSQPLHPLTKQYLDNINSDVQNRLNNLTASVNSLATDSVTKAYIDRRIDEVMLYIAATINSRYV